MSAQNGSLQSDTTQQRFNRRIEDLKAGILKMMDSVTTSETSRIRAFADKATQVIKAHPMVAIGVAFGLGYVVMRIARR